jgi:hypothetical protein
MNLIVCVDKSFGMSFGGRRLSRDGEVIRKIVEVTEGANLFVDEYSAVLFQGNREVICEPQFLSKAQSGDFCFAEISEIPYDRIESIYLFHWNRDYPADQYFQNEILHFFQKKKKEDFVGSSHKKITLEIYIRV